MPDSHLKLGARYYNPTTARFTQPDPSGKEANTYIYAGDDPTNLVDPTGYAAWADTFFAVVGVAAAVAAFVTAPAWVPVAGAYAGAVTAEYVVWRLWNDAPGPSW
jgi:hypothetical protein